MRRLRIGDPPNQKSLRVRDEGESKRPALVCVHGAGSSSVIFMDLVRRLSPRIDFEFSAVFPPQRSPSPVALDLVETLRDALEKMNSAVQTDHAVPVSAGLV